jgi:hypothetical protein
MTATTIHELKGLEPDNLLAFLALLGLLRALETAKPDWRPRIAWTGTPLAAQLDLAVPAKAAEIASGAEAGIKRIGKSYAVLGGKKDLKFTSDEFRVLARAAKSEVESRVVAALASNGALKRDEKEVEPTALCAMFGQGHQHFLERLRELTSDGTMEDIARALFEVWRYEDDTDGFRWDPNEDRRYALQFGDPSESKNKIGTVKGANRLAAIGFGALASAPTAAGLATLGSLANERRQRHVCWPLVEVPTSLAGHLALLAHPGLGDEETATRLASYGVAGVARARRVQVGKFVNFARARIQFL